MPISVCDFGTASGAFAVAGSPVTVRAFRDEAIALPAEGTHFGFVWQGDALLRRDRQRSPLPVDSGMYFSVAESAVLDGQNAAGLVVNAPDYRGQFLLGGPVESVGRFPYIDGGTTSLLVAPMAVGDPCLHALYMPPNVDQTVHHHPSDRIGIIINGSGQCCGEDTCDALRPGSLFYISADQRHRFVTGERGLDLVVFHPDSDMGFSDRSHPMLSRTLVNDVRATDLPELQTLL
ncbi:MAG: cupin domain-containing protein [Cyanobacteria bacterium J06581_3]